MLVNAAQPKLGKVGRVTPCAPFEYPACLAARTE